MDIDPPRYEAELAVRRELVALCQAMLCGEMTFFEGAMRVCSLRSGIGAREDDPDFNVFIVIRSETDHLPPAHIQHRWSQGALQSLRPEFEKTEVWAKSFASKACRNLVQRFSEPAFDKPGGLD